MKKIGILLLLLSSIGYAQVTKIGTAGAKFLSIGVGPRGIGMGGAATAVTNDVTSLYWNPAGITLAKKSEAVFSDVEWFYDIRNNFVGYITPVPGLGVFGVGITALTMGDEEITTIEESEGTGYYWGANSIALSLSYGRWFTTEFAFGLSVKLLRESIWKVTSTGLAFDMGVLLYPGVFKRMKLGLSITNFGPDMQFKGAREDMFREDWTSITGPVEVELVSRPYPLPLCIKMGIAYDILDTPMNRLILAVDFAHPNDSPERLHTGLEYGWSDMMFLRAGFTYDSNLWDDRCSMEGAAFGVGFKYPIGGMNYKIDYAGEDRGRLGIQHRFALGLGF